MRIFDENKTNELTEYDLDKGYLKPDKLLISHHEAVEAVQGKFHYETIKEYPNGGKDVKKVWDIEPKPAKEAYDEYEDINVYIPYTEKELERQYALLVERYIRQKYSLSAELAILRQRDTKPEEFAEYNAYAEQCKAKAKEILGQ